MGDLPQIIIPDLKDRPRPAAEDRIEWLRRWERDYADGRETIEPPRNIWFIHDPFWRERVWSIQNAHERKSLVWKVTEGLLYLASVGLGLGMFSAKRR